MGTSFRWLLGSWISNLGDGLALAAGPLLVASETHDPFLVALAGLLQRLPWLLLRPVRRRRRRPADRRRSSCRRPAARRRARRARRHVVTGQVNIAVVLVAMFLLGVAEVFADTASATLLPMVVAKADLGIGNARLMAGFLTLNQLVGPPIGAALFAARRGLAVRHPGRVRRARRPAGLAHEAARPRPRAGEATRVRADIAEGLRWTWGNAAGPHADPHDRDLQRHLRRRLVGPRALRIERLDLGPVGFGLLTTALARRRRARHRVVRLARRGTSAWARSCGSG